MKRIAAHFIALVVVLGILAPQGAGLLAAAGLADGRVLVICTGDGLRTLRIGDDGKPVEISQTADFCALVHAADTATPPSPAPAPGKLLEAREPIIAQPLRALALARLCRLPRAPPLA